MSGGEGGGRRVVALAGHSGSGKTSLADSMLVCARAVSRTGSVDEGTSWLDFEPEERERRMTLSTAAALLQWRDCSVQLLDTPGYPDFSGEMRAALRVADGALIVVDAGSNGQDAGTEEAMAVAEAAQLPVLFCISRLDRDNASFEQSLEMLRERFGEGVAALQWPVGRESTLSGWIDLTSVDDAAWPEEQKPLIDAERLHLMERAAEQEDDLLERYLDEGTLSRDALLAGLRKGVLSGKLRPVLLSSCPLGLGADAALDAIVSLLPAPEERACNGQAPFSTLVFKTTADPYMGKLSMLRLFSGKLQSDSVALNAQTGRQERIGQLYRLHGKEQQPVPAALAGDIVAVARLQGTVTGQTLCDPSHPCVLPGVEFPAPVYTLGIQPRDRADEDKISQALARMVEEDPGLHFERDTETRQLLLSGAGDVHLEVACRRLARKYGVDIVTEPLRIPYRETITGSSRAEGKHKKQSGGRGQYGHVLIEVEPLERGEGFEFQERIFGGAVPRQFIPAVEKGIRESLAEGVLAGYPVTDLRVTLIDGSYHSVDSSELAFKIAASIALKKALAAASPVLMEPIRELSVTVPEACMGDVIGDIDRKRGRILGVEAAPGVQTVQAVVPAAELSAYAVDLRSLTQGRGRFTARMSHYEPVPADLQRSLCAP